jgi:chemotaxis protein histidine kinase CheA/ActR/RegA family two-component response regulator
MNISNQVDFETFYFHSLLESIRKQSENRFEGAMYQNLDKFVDFLSSGENPLASIDQLARVQGTSDISIFFSDLIERINEYAPEEAVGMIDDYATDFLEIFNELATEPAWESHVFRDLLGIEPTTETEVTETEATENKLDIYTFIGSHIKDQVLHNFKDEDESIREVIAQMLNRLGEKEQLLQLSDLYQNISEFQGLIFMLQNLLKPPQEKALVESYISDFFMNLDDLNRELKRLYIEHTDAFLSFCKAEEISEKLEMAEATEKGEVDEVEKIEKDLKEPRISKSEVAAEDENLRLLLRDYIVNEIKELSDEIVTSLNKVVKDPSKENLRSIVLENLKVVKDLSQIHKYPAIEQITNNLNNVIRKQFTSGKIVAGNSIDLLNKLFSNYTLYIDAVLNDNEKPVAEELRNAEKIFLASLESVEPVEAQFAFQNSDVVKEAFQFTQSRFLERIETNYAIFLDTRSAESQSALKSDLSHLSEWYGIWNLVGPNHVLEIFKNWLNKEEKYEKLALKKKEIQDSFQKLATHLFSAIPDEWTELIEKLTAGQATEKTVDISASLEAYKEVTQKQISKIINSLGKEDLQNSKLLSEAVLPELQHIVDNSTLAKNIAMLDVATYFLEKINELEDFSDKETESVRENFRDLFNDWNLAVSQLPKSLSAEKLKRKYDKLFKQSGGKKTTKSKGPVKETEKSETGKSGSREEFVDEELVGVFQEETQKHLNEIEKLVEKVSGDLENKSGTEQLISVLHTLKGSAQMVNRGDIAELIGPMEELSELLLQGRVQPRKQFVLLCKRMVKALKRLLENKKIQPNRLLNSIDSYISKYKIEGEFDTSETNNVNMPPEALSNSEAINDEVSIDKSVIEETGKEPLLKLSEMDPELLEIFKNEASENLNNIERDLALVEEQSHNKKTLQSLDHAVHEIRSAAKMLGFSEIGVLIDGLEELIELISKKDHENWAYMIPAIRNSVQVIRDLTENRQIPLSHYEETTNAVSLHLDTLKSQGEDNTGSEPKGSSFQEIAEEGELSETVISSFIQEAREYLEDINFLLMKMEKNPGDQELAQRLMRTLHTLKGSASMVYLETPEKLAHLSEDILEEFLSHSEPLPQNLYDLLFDVVDEIDFIISGLVDGERNKTKNFDTIITQLEAMKAGSKTLVDKKVSKGRANVPEETDQDKPDQNNLSISEEPEIPRAKPRDTYIRLHVQQMDNLLNETAEMVVNHTQFKKQLDSLKNNLPRLDMEGKNLQNILWYLDEIIKEEQQIIGEIEPLTKNSPSLLESQQKQVNNLKGTIENLKKFSQSFNQILQNFKDSGKLYDEQIHKILRLSNQIHESIMNARLVPVDLLFQRFHRPLRDLARKYNKKVKLLVSGEETELDRTLVEELFEPLLHILRNAIDHGIELPSERKKVGKPEEGIIKLSATRERNFVSFYVEDDGKGIDIEKVKQRAIDLGYLEKSEANSLTEQEVFEYMMFSGFSTSTVKTELSGRGMGLDIVKNQIQKIKGDIRIYSEKGKGSRFQVRVPISLTVTQAMLVNVDNNIYAVPLLQVEETFDLDKKELLAKDGNYYMDFRGGKIPVIKLSSLLQMAEAKQEVISKSKKYPVVIVQDEGNMVALLVDKILHREEILIKSLGKGLQGIRFISGGSVLADGRVVLVLDVRQLVLSGLRKHRPQGNLMPEAISEKRKKGESEPKRTDQSRVKRVVEGRKPLILVVDDSLSIRKFLAGFLTKKDFEVETAKNGYHALELLNQKDFDLLVTDLEMPNLSGYELIEQVRAEARWDNLPIIVLTGRASQHIQQMTMKLGANEFMIKPFKEDDLLNKIFNFIEHKK